MKKTKILMLWGLAAAASSLTLHAAEVCPIERAHYSYTNGSGSADFIVLKNLKNYISNLALHITLKNQIAHLKANQKTKQFWFLFDHGSAPITSLVSTTDVMKPELAGFEIQGWLCGAVV